MPRVSTPPPQVLLAVNSVTDVARQRALAVSGLEMDGTHGTHSALRSGGRGERPGRCVDPYSMPMV